MLTTKSVQEFLDELASSSPAPGGGSVAALAAALGTGLTAMVCRLTIGKKKYVDVQSEMERILTEAEELRARATQLVDEDTEAFQGVMAAFGLPKETPEQQERRTLAIQQATKRATIVPLKVMQVCEAGIELARRVAEKGNKNSISDAGVAALMLHAACTGAAMNVRINLGGIRDESFALQVRNQTVAIAQRVEQVIADTLFFVNKAMEPLIPT
jgi:formiminotetrahydrofolate cyclodeaminase